MEKLCCFSAWNDLFLGRFCQLLENFSWVGWPGLLNSSSTPLQDGFVDSGPSAGQTHCPLAVFSLLKHNPNFIIWTGFTPIAQQNPEPRNQGHFCPWPPAGPFSGHFASWHPSSKHWWNVDVTGDFWHEDDARKCPHNYRVKNGEPNLKAEESLNILPLFDKKISLGKGRKSTDNKAAYSQLLSKLEQN